MGRDRRGSIFAPFQYYAPLARGARKAMDTDHLSVGQFFGIEDVCV